MIILREVHLANCELLSQMRVNDEIHLRKGKEWLLPLYSHDCLPASVVKSSTNCPIWTRYIDIYLSARNYSSLPLGYSCYFSMETIKLTFENVLSLSSLSILYIYIHMHIFFKYLQIILLLLRTGKKIQIRFKKKAKILISCTIVVIYYIILYVSVRI